jgi:hypothetical protein
MDFFTYCLLIFIVTVVEEHSAYKLCVHVCRRDRRAAPPVAVLQRLLQAGC